MRWSPRNFRAVHTPDSGTQPDIPGKSGAAAEFHVALATPPAIVARNCDNRSGSGGYMKLPLCFLGALVAIATPATPAWAGMDRFAYGPAIADFGAVAKVDSDQPLAPGIDY